MFDLNLSKQAFKFLKALKGTKRANQIKSKIQSMLEDPYPTDSIKSKRSNSSRCQVRGWMPIMMSASRS